MWHLANSVGYIALAFYVLAVLFWDEPELA